MLTGIPQTLLEEARNYVSTHFGIHYQDARLTEFSHNLTTISKRTGHQNAADFVHALMKGELSEELLDLLIAAITVGETYFFREAEALEAIVGSIIPAVAGSGTRRLRIWIAGCASGEEAYSVAMLLHSRLPDLSAWDISVLASDINRSSLRKAEEATYTSWSFRAIPVHMKSRYFHQRPDGRYELDETIRRMVRFERINLVSGYFPSPLNGTQECDLILCRNVLMYFAPEMISAIAARLARSIGEHGWLIVSQTECSPYFATDFDTVQVGNIFLYRKKSASIAPLHSLSPQKRRPQAAFKPVKAAVDKAPAKISQSPGEPQLRKPAEVRGTPPVVPAPEEMFRQARTLADAGELEEASALCEAGLAGNSLTLKGHYLHAAILQEMGRLDDARDALRKVLYIDPDSVMATYTLGTIEQKLGNRRRALNYFDKSARALAAYKDGDMLQEAEGLTAGHLKEFIDARRKG